MDNLTEITVNENHPNLSTYNGGVYNKNYTELLF